MLTTTREEIELRRELVPNGLAWVIKDETEAARATAVLDAHVDLKSRRCKLCKHPHHLGRCKICKCPD